MARIVAVGILACLFGILTVVGIELFYRFIVKSEREDRVKDLL
jgi:hypothetical protein